MRQIATLILATLLSSQLAVAAPVKKDMQAIEKAITTELGNLDPTLAIKSIQNSPIDGVYMVILQRGNILYSSANGKHLLTGDMLEIRDNGIVNLSDEIRSKANAKKLKAANTDDMIIFKPKGKTKSVVYAFTDVDCGYCRKLHQEVAEMNELGIELRYMAFPRGGPQAPAYAKMTDAWCSDDRKAAITALKTGNSIPATEDANKKSACETIINTQYKLGTELGVNGTPAMVLENGQMIPGYRPAKDLAKLLAIDTTEKSNPEN